MKIAFDTAAFEADMAAIARDIERNAASAVKTALHDAAQATNEYGYQNKTGELTGTRRETFWHGPGGFSGAITWPANHAFWIDAGRGPVRPVNKKWLRYYIGSRVIFSKYSKPTKPARFSELARTVLDTTAHNRLESGVDSAIQAHT